MDTPSPSQRYKSPSPSPPPAPPPPPSNTTTTTSWSRPAARITATTTTTTTTTHRVPRRNSPYLPTPTEQALLASYPALLLFGAAYAALSPDTRAAASAYDPARHTYRYHDYHYYDGSAPREDGADGSGGRGGPPSYFARKDNLLNLLFVKRGWAWVTAAFAVFVLTHPALRLRRGQDQGRGQVRGRSGGLNLGMAARAVARWAAVTLWWVFVTRWFFGPPIIDRGFRWTGGKCEGVLLRAADAADGSERDGGGGDGGGAAAAAAAAAGVERLAEVVSAAACKASGGSWMGGHDISGHVFLLVLGSFFLVQEVGWVVARWARWVGEERCVVMPDGAVKGAGVEAADRRGDGYGHDDGAAVPVLDALGLGGKFAAGVVALCGWMLLMTAIYFHTWLEKLTGLLVALAGLYITYILPRWVPALRNIIGLPGI